MGAKLSSFGDKNCANLAWEDPVWGTKIFSSPIGDLTNFSGGKENQSISEINNFFTRSLKTNLNGRKLDIYILKRLA